MRLLLALVVPIFWLAGPITAQPVDTDRITQLVEEMLDTGADGAALADLAQTTTPTDGADQLGTDRTERLQRAWHTAFAERALRADVATFIAERESANSVSAAVDWLRAPVVSRVTSRMREATGTEFDRAFGQWIASLRDDELDTERLSRIVLISERSGEERVGDVVLGIAEASVRGAHAVAAAGDRPDLSEALDRLNTLGPTLTAQAIVQNQLYLYYVLRDLPVSDLDAYADALASPAGRWYVSTMADAMTHAIEQAGGRLLQTLGGR